MSISLNVANIRGIFFRAALCALLFLVTPLESAEATSHTPDRVTGTLDPLGRINSCEALYGKGHTVSFADDRSDLSDHSDRSNTSMPSAHSDTRASDAAAVGAGAGSDASAERDEERKKTGASPLVKRATKRRYNTTGDEASKSSESDSAEESGPSRDELINRAMRVGAQLDALSAKRRSISFGELARGKKRIHFYLQHPFKKDFWGTPISIHFWIPAQLLIKKPTVGHHPSSRIAHEEGLVNFDDLDRDKLLSTTNAYCFPLRPYTKEEAEIMRKDRSVTLFPEELWEYISKDMFDAGKLTIEDMRYQERFEVCDQRTALDELEIDRQVPLYVEEGGRKTSRKLSYSE